MERENRDLSLELQTISEFNVQSSSSIAITPNQIEIESLQANNKTLISEKETLNRKLEESNSKLSDQKTNFEELIRQNKEFESLIIKQSKENSTLNEQNTMLNQEVQNQRIDNENLQSKISKLEIIFRQNSLRKEDNQFEIDSKITEIMDLKKQLTVANKKLQSCEDHSRESFDSIQNFSRLFKKLSKELELTKQSNNHLLSEVEFLRHENFTLNQMQVKQNSQLHFVHVENEELPKLQDDFQLLQQEFETLQNDNNDLKQKQKKIDTEIRKYENKIASLQKEILALKKNNQDLGFRVKDDIPRLIKQLDTKDEQLLILKKQLLQRNPNQEVTLYQVSSITSSPSPNDVSNENENLRQLVSAKDEEISSLKNEIKQKIKENAHLRDKFTQALTQNAILEMKINPLNDDDSFSF